MESKTRSLVKALIWQIMGLILMVIVGYLFTGSLKVGGAMAGMNALIGLLTYLIYERIWAKVSWGRVTFGLR